MSASERVCNAAVGLNMMVLAVAGMVVAGSAERFTPLRICVTLLGLTVGWLFVVRKPLLRRGSLRSVFLTLPSVIGGLVAMSLAPPPNVWPIQASGLFVAGTALAFVSLVYLGGSFAIFPADRGTVDRGPYRLIRHPAYLGEFLLVIACVLAVPEPATVWLPLAVLPCIVIRILAEERLLVDNGDYRAYARRVVWRLVPGIW